QHLLQNEFADLDCKGASVHSGSSLQAAFQRGLSYAVLGAVKETASHPGQAGLGWTCFQDIVVQARLPVYAIGGLGEEDIKEARQRGAHGVALLSRFPQA
ncbi:MAG TPA: thiamine phosphate synthase, partial [Limnobacter sp.]|nr:thiamine phosphate synthase [Limnobacter sp.]